jgi:hypothetical protein
MAKTYPSGFGKIIWRIPGPNKASDAIITSDFELLSGPTSGTPTPDQVATAIASRANVVGLQLFQTRMGVGWRYEGVKVTYKLLATEYAAELMPVPAPIGTLASPAPPQIAMVVRKTSSLVGRRNRGRFYVPAMLTDSAIDDAGVLIPATVTSMQALFNTFLTGLAAPATALEAQLALAIVHTPPKNGTATPPPNRVQSLAVQALTATQRRRIR